MSPREWRFRIRDILAAVKVIADNTAGLTFEAFRDHQMTMQAVAFNFFIIGEAAGAVPEDIRAAHPEIPWAQMRRMRNVIGHQYFALDPWILWDSAHNDLPSLVAPFEALLSTAP